MNPDILNVLTIQTFKEHILWQPVWYLKMANQAKKDGEPIAPTDLRSELASKWFDLTTEDTSQKYAPKFGALLSYFARKERNGGFANPVMNASAQKTWDSQVCLSYLLGFDWRLPQQLQSRPFGKFWRKRLCRLAS